MIGTPASDEQVLCAEQELGVKFSSDYIDFIKNFGTAYAGMMINALDGNENVVEETKSLREVHPEVTDTYVISDDGSGNPIMINSKGEVEIYYHDSDAEIKTIAPSLEQYIEDNFRPLFFRYIELIHQQLFSLYFRCNLDILNFRLKICLQFAK